MAKSKRSRRAQPVITERQQQPEAGGAAQAATAVNGSISSAGKVEVAGQPRRKTVDFAEEYYYVYLEMRNILIVAGLMFLVMVGLAYFI